jgi:hypothetical protein
MILGDLDTEVVTAQLNLLFGVQSIFKRRGRLVSSCEDIGQLLFDPTAYDAFERYYPIFHSSAFRRVVGIVANSQKRISVEEIITKCPDLKAERIKEILEKAVTFGLLHSEDLSYLPSNSVGFGPTFEWYVAAVCQQELASIAYWGVKVEKLTGDYDVVLVRENQVGYVECKSGRLSNITRKDVESFLERERVLSPQFSIYLVDGISRESVDTLVNFALQEKREYEYEMAGVMNTSVSLEAEEYENFVRLVPINAFFLAMTNSVITALREVYEFLTLVCDRGLPTENIAAKAKFRLQKPGP